MPVCMSLMAIWMELSTAESPWSFQQGDFLTSSTGALERNGTTLRIAWQRKVFISWGCAGSGGKRARN
jgi:hypothetical protein